MRYVDDSFSRLHGAIKIFTMKNSNKIIDIRLVSEIVGIFTIQWNQASDLFELHNSPLVIFKTQRLERDCKHFKI